MFLLNHISCPLLLYPRTLHTFCQLHQNMTSTKGICRPCKTLESKCSQKQMLRQRFKSKYLGAGVGEEGSETGKGRKWMVVHGALPSKSPRWPAGAHGSQGSWDRKECATVFSQLRKTGSLSPDSCQSLVQVRLPLRGIHSLAGPAYPPTGNGAPVTKVSS